MTTEEVIQILNPETRREALRKIPVMERIAVDQEACRMAVAALRAQQASAKLDRNRWEGCEGCRTDWPIESWGEGGAHDFRLNGDALFFYDEMYGWEGIEIKYCPFCGRPLTEGAWAELERRIGGNDGTTK